MSSSLKRNISQLLGDEEDSRESTRNREKEEPPKIRQRLNGDNDLGVDAPTVATFTPTRTSIRTKASNGLPARPPSPNRVSFAGPDSTSIISPTLPYPPQTLKPRSIPFQQPSQLITFSYTPSHVQEFTDSALRYYSEPPLGANLKYGYERWRRRDDERGRIDSLLRAVLEVKKKDSGLPQIGVVAWRGVMTKILTAPYENRDGWEMNVMCVDGTLYFEEHLTEAKLQEKNNMDERQRLMTYYGYAFESYSTSEAPPPPQSTAPEPAAHPNVPPGWSGDVDTNVQWCSVVRTKLGDVRMILGGEVDCVRGKYTGNTDTFVELKTSLAIRGHYDETKFERKLLKFYFQSFLLGVPEIVVGFRTPAGVVSTVQSFKTIQLPRLVRGKPGAWDPLVCIDWGYQVLTLLKGLQPGRREGQTRDADGDATDAPMPVHMWRVKFVPGTGIQVEELDEAGIEEVQNGEDRVGLLPRWYWDEVNTVSPASEAAAAGDRLTAANLGWNI